MTIEVAKEIFLNRGYVNVNGGILFDGDKWRDACIVISKWLEQEPCDDCVSKAELLKKYEDRSFELQKAHRKDTQAGVNWCINTLKEMPPVTSVRKEGKWIGDKAYPICPKCNCNIIEEYISCSDYAEMYKPMKYCPNCGLKMEAE